MRQTDKTVGKRKSVAPLTKKGAAAAVSKALSLVVALLLASSPLTPFTAQESAYADDIPQETQNQDINNEEDPNGGVDSPGVGSQDSSDLDNPVSDNESPEAIDSQESDSSVPTEQNDAASILTELPSGSDEKPSLLDMGPLLQKLESQLETEAAYIVTLADAPAVLDGFYQLASSDDLIWFSWFTLSLTTRTTNAKLIADIDLSLENWEPIGGAVSATAYGGIFDGNNKTVTLNINSTKEFVGLFGFTYGATIKNLTVTGTVKGQGYTAGIVGYAWYTSLINVTNKADITAGSPSGGIAGYLNGSTTVLNAVNDGSVIAGGNAGVAITGGIAGLGEYQTLIKDSTNNGSIKGTDYVGGIIGRSSGTVTGNINNGSVYTSITYAGGTVGGIVGSGVTVTNNINRGSISRIKVEGIDTPWNIGAIAGIIGSSGFANNLYVEGSAERDGQPVLGLRYTLSNQEYVPSPFESSCSPVPAELAQLPVVSEPTVVVTKYPTKLLYQELDSFDITGFDAVVVYPDGSSAQINAAKINYDNHSALTSANNQINITVTPGTDGLESVNITCPITVRDLFKLQVISPPKNKFYLNGTALDISDIKISAIYASGEVALDTTDWSVTPTSLGYQDKKVTVSYTAQGITHVVDITGFVVFDPNAIVPTDVDGYYKISSEADLLWFQYKVNNVTNRSFNARLMADIDVSGSNWTPIGTTATATTYNGTFDGNGKTITYSIEDTVTSSKFYQGLFSWLAAPAVIKDLTVKGTISIRDNASSTGGIAGYVDTGVTLNNLTSEVDITAGHYVGGIAGQMRGTATITGAVNHGDILGLGGNGNVGGIVGNTATTNSVTKSINNGAVKGSADFVGGIVGQAGGSITGNTNNSSVTSTSLAPTVSVGGIIGGLTVASTFDSNYNKGLVSLTDSASPRIGGIIGYTTLAATTDLSNNMFDYGTAERAIGLSTVARPAIPPVVAEPTIYVLSAPTKLLYIEGEPFNPAGFSVAVIYPDGTATATTDFTVTNTSALTPDDTEVTINVAPNIADLTIEPASFTYSIHVANSEGFYSLSSAQDFIWFAEQVSTATGKGTKAQLAENIDLSNSGWTALANYAGTFDGNAKTVTIKATQGLFTSTNGATIKNLTVAGSVTATTVLGAVVGTATNTTVTDVTNKAAVTITSSSNAAGGIIGAGTTVTLSNVINEGNITGRDIGGGIIGTLTSGTVKNATNYGLISGNNNGSTSTPYWGGIVGNNVNVSSIIEDCVNNGRVVGASSASNTNYLGGIVGYGRGTIKNNVNNGSIERSWVSGQPGHIGGIAGIGTGTFIGNINNGAVTTNTTDNRINIGGILGDTSGIAVVVSSNINKGAVSITAINTSQNIGAIAGQITAQPTQSTQIVNNLYAKGSADRPFGVCNFTLADNAALEIPTEPDTLPSVLVPTVVLTHLPNKLLYRELDYFDITGFIAVVAYPDGSSASIDSSKFSYDNHAILYTTDSLIKITVAPESDGLQAVTFNIPIVVNRLFDLKITKNPSRTIYYPNESFDKADIGLSAVYATQEVPLTPADFSVTPEVFTKGYTQATVSFTDQGVTHTLIVPGLTIFQIAEPQKDNDGVTYLLDSADDLFWFAQFVNASTANRGTDAILTSDINVSSFDWTPIGGSTATTAYTGSFNGNGKTITVDIKSELGFVGLFGYVSGATITDLTLAGSVTGTSATTNYTGGIVAWAAANTKLMNLTNDATVTGRLTTGGIAAYITGDGCIIEGATNNGSITITTASYAGGIAGNKLTGSVINKSVNNGAVTCMGTGPSNVGGITGQNYGILTNNINNGLISSAGISTSTVHPTLGGITGLTQTNSTVTGNINKAKVQYDQSDESYIGAIVGSTGSSTISANYYVVGTAERGIGVDTSSSRPDNATQAITSGDVYQLDIYAPPVRHLYKVGESFDTNDIKIMAISPNGVTELKPQDLTITPAVFSAGDRKVVVSYTANNITSTVEVTGLVVYDPTTEQPPAVAATLKIAAENQSGTKATASGSALAISAEVDDIITVTADFSTVEGVAYGLTAGFSYAPVGSEPCLEPVLDDWATLNPDVTADTSIAGVLRINVENTGVPYIAIDGTETITLKFKVVKNSPEQIVLKVGYSNAPNRGALITEVNTRLADLQDANGTFTNAALDAAAGEGTIKAVAATSALRPNTLLINTTGSIESNIPFQADIDWYLANPDADVFYISSPAELYGLRYLVHYSANELDNSGGGGCDFKGKTINLTKDINLATDVAGINYAALWKPIGAGANVLEPLAVRRFFRGTFDGHDHTISGLSGVLFQQVSGATLKNFSTSGTISAKSNTSSDYNGETIGVVAVAIDSDLRNLKSDVRLINNFSMFTTTAGIVGIAYGHTSITDCEFSGSIEGTEATYHTGGILGSIGLVNFHSVITITNCVNRANIKGSYNVGGIVGGTPISTVLGDAEFTGDVIISGCTNYGSITSTSWNYFAGTAGIIGGSGFVTPSDATSHMVSIDRCANYGSISGPNSNVAGIAAAIQQGDKASITNSFNAGTVTAAHTDDRTTVAAGGIIGRLDDASGAYLANNYNAGTISANGDVAIGGFIGQVDGIAKGSNNYYLDSTAAAAVNSGDYAIVAARTDAAMRKADFATLLGTAFSPSTGSYPYPILLERTNPSVNAPDLVDGCYQLATSEDIIWFANQVNNGNAAINAILTGDSYAVSTPSFRGIGTKTSKYSGTFDGNGKTVTVSISADDGYIGFFGVIDGATIKNLTIDGFVLSYSDYAGGIVGFASNASIDNCINNANIVGRTDAAIIGGIAGYVTNTTINDCLNTGKISYFGGGGWLTTGNGSGYGGIVGRMDNSTISGSLNIGDVFGNNAGGLAGSTTGTNTISNSASTGATAGGEKAIPDYVGGSITFDGDPRDGNNIKAYIPGNDVPTFDKWYNPSGPPVVPIEPDLGSPGLNDEAGGGTRGSATDGASDGGVGSGNAGDPSDPSSGQSASGSSGSATSAPTTTPSATPTITPGLESNPSVVETGNGSEPSFFEVISKAVANNPIVVIALVIVAAVLAFAGGIWRYRRSERS